LLSNTVTHHPSLLFIIVIIIVTGMLAIGKLISAVVMLVQAQAFLSSPNTRVLYQKAAHRLYQRHDETNEKELVDNERRKLLSIPTTMGVCLLTLPGSAIAKSKKSRTDGYAIQKTEKEWDAQLSDMQYFVLRQGGTESPNFSILESEDRPGIFSCAGCGTDLFDSQEKVRYSNVCPSGAMCHR